MIPGQQLMDHFSPDWENALLFASKLHLRPVSELASAAFLCAVDGKTTAQFQSGIRRELKPTFGPEKLQEIVAAWGRIYGSAEHMDPLELLLQKEDEQAKAGDDIWEFDSAELARKLGISRRMAQIKIKKLKEEINLFLIGAPGQKMLDFAGGEK